MNYCVDCVNMKNNYINTGVKDEGGNFMQIQESVCTHHLDRINKIPRLCSGVRPQGVYDEDMNQVECAAFKQSKTDG